MQRAHAILVFALLIAAAFGTGKIRHACVHDDVKMADIPVEHQNYEPAPVQRAFSGEAITAAPPTVLANAFKPMRVKYYWDYDKQGTCDYVGQSVSTFINMTNTTCLLSDLISVQKAKYFDALLRRAAITIGSLLSVIPITNGLIAPLKCGNAPGITISKTTKMNISGADFVIFATAVEKQTRGDTAAWAFACALDTQGRPTVGHINFIPHNFNDFNVTGDNFESDFHIAIHELTHALGFSAPFFSKGVKLNPKVTGKITKFYPAFGKNLTKLNSPAVLAKAKAFFGCPTLDGVEIEDQGGSGTAGSHWEKRILGEEYMSGVLSTRRQYISPLTLAYFEDTGLYQANYAKAEVGMLWGAATGCDIVDFKCNSGKPGALKTFCFGSVNSRCMPDRGATSFCWLANFSGTIPANFAYFANKSLGGAVAAADYCPVVHEFNNVICNKVGTPNSSIYGTTFSTTSMCFQSTLLSNGYVNKFNEQGRCFIQTCGKTTAGAKTLHVTVNGNKLLCPTAGGNITFPGFTGSVVCPSTASVC